MEINIFARIVIDIFLLIACSFAFAGVWGMLHLPDVFSRMQSSTIISVVWFLCLMLAGIVYGFFVAGNGATGGKVFLVGMFTVFTAPIIGHAIARASYIYGDRPRRPLEPDEFGKDRPWERPGEYDAPKEGGQ